jgi:hypothetical protein
MSTPHEVRTARDWLASQTAARVVRDDRAGEARERRLHTGAWKRKRSVPGVAKVFPCWACGAPDARQPDHARGCPQLPPVPREIRLQLALEIEDAWAAKAERRTHAPGANGS